MKISLGEMPVILDALRVRSVFGELPNGPFVFERETYKNLFEKLCNYPDIAISLEVLEKQPEEKRGATDNER